MMKYEVVNGLIVAENLSETKKIKVEMKKWTAADDSLFRYYVKRDGQSIGWISGDKQEGKGQFSSTNQTYIDRMIRALAGEKIEI